MKRTLFLGALFSLLAATLLGCSGDFIKALQDQTALRDKLIQEYGWQGVNTVLQNDSALGISFVNSPFNRLDKTMQQAKAREIATFAKKNYGSSDRLSQIWVSFVIYDRLYGIIDFTNSLDTWFFDVAELGVQDILSTLTNEFQTVYQFDAARVNTPFPTQTFGIFGIAGITLGVVMAAIGIWLARKRKENTFYILAALGVLAICGGILFGSIGFGLGAVLSRTNNDLATAITAGKAQVAEGPVQVLFEQPRGGHTKGDIVKIGNKQFEISYYVAKPTYHQTIAYGGVLRKGVYARVHYVGEDIVKIEVKKP